MTQRITKTDHREWRMYDSDHSMTSNPDRGWATLEIKICWNGSLDILATETGNRTKLIGMNLKPDTVRALAEWFKAYAQEPATNGGDEQGTNSTATQISELDNRLT
jgi:hypothetical protein